MEEGDSFADAIERLGRGAASPAEVACAFLVEEVRARVGSRWRQGERKPALPSEGLPPSVRVVAGVRLSRVEEAVARGLVAWARGERDVELRFDVPAPRHVLSLQARGARCVSLLPAAADAGPHEDALAFALHDLCHLEKFSDPAHHVAQVGFFARVDRAMRGEAWAALDARFDAAWREDVEHVVADMNGSPIFLFAALKMKLKMASRRELARARGLEARTFGPLDDDEARAFAAALEDMLDALGLEGRTRDAARAITTKRDAHEAARTLLVALEGEGSVALAGQRAPRSR